MAINAIRDGYGYGSGYGYGDGYWQVVYRTLAASLARPQRRTLDAASGVGFWRSTREAKPANGGDGEAVSPGLVQKCDGPLKICHRGFHATVDPSRWKGDRLWLVALRGEVQRDGDKMAALEREIICEVPLGRGSA